MYFFLLVDSCDRHDLEIELVHNLRQLSPYIISVLQGAIVDEVLVTPLRVLTICEFDEKLRYNDITNALFRPISIGCGYAAVYPWGGM